MSPVTPLREAISCLLADIEAPELVLESGMCDHETVAEYLLDEAHTLLYRTLSALELASLTDELNAWFDAQGIAPMSADEAILEDVTAEQRAYLVEFIQRWEDAQEVKA
jgi:hypothetical protein